MKMLSLINEQLPNGWWLHWDLYWCLVGSLFAGIVSGLFKISTCIKQDKKDAQKIQFIIAILAYLTMVSYCFFKNTKTMFCEYLLISGVAMFGIYQCKYIAFTSKEYICIWALLMNTTIHGYGVVIEEQTVICVALLVVGLVKVKEHSCKGKWLSIWMFVITLCAHIMLFREIYYLLFKDLNNYLIYTFGRTISIRLLFFVGVGILFLVFTVGLVYLEKRYLGSWYDAIVALSKTYTVIDKYFIIGIAFDCVLICATNNVHLLRDLLEVNRDVLFFSLMEWISIFVIFLQVTFVVLLTQVSRQKIQLRRQALHNENMQVYYNQLENNLTEIRAVKHDLKNMFLTMGEYVNRSNDEEMKAFYQEAIYPLADQEMRMNDCFVALEQIGNEQLKAFLFYKLSYGINNGIDMKLMVHLSNQEQVQIPQDWEFIEDLVRILGVWLDNAMEECKEVGSKANCLIQVKQKEQCLLFQVENTVRTKVQEQGIERGITTKGLGRGNGLLYVEKIIGKYQNCIWNSYFKEGNFIQSMMFEMSNDMQ